MRDQNDLCREERLLAGIDQFVQSEDGDDLLPDWKPIEKTPKAIGWYACHHAENNDFDAAGKVARYWDGECWMQPTRKSGFRPNNSFTHWTELPDFYT